MTLRSIGLRTDLWFHVAANAVIAEREGFLAIRTPDQPDYYWGNCLVLASPPTVEQLPLWEQRFDREFHGLRSQHRAFTWDVAPPLADRVVERFREAGYDHGESVVLVAERTQPPPHPNADCVVRRIESDAEWNQVVELQTDVGFEEFAEFFGSDRAAVRAFVVRGLAPRRRMIARGAGLWMGAFLGRELVADAGLFWDGDVARVQAVETRATHRRRGLCATLLHRMSGLAFGALGIHALVIEADIEGGVAGIYRSVGFVDRERLGSLLCASKDSPRDGSNPT
jgi:hypothetical protein